jgi:hypothetical protein
LDPTNVLTVAKNGYVKIRWQAVRGAAEYRIETATSDFSAVRFAAKTENTTYSINPSHDYAFIRLVAVSEEGVEARSRWCTVWSESPNLILPSEPAIDSRGITRLRWVPVLRTVRYKIQIADSHLTLIFEAFSGRAKQAIRVPSGAEYIRVIAIDKHDEEKPGGWTPVSDVLYPRRDR